MHSFWNNFTKKRLISAHRGNRSIRAENTISAFEASLNRADFFEFDVRFTKDKVAIVSHDDTLDRTSNVEDIAIFREPYRVMDYTYSEIKKLDFSSWFVKKDPFGTIKKNIVRKDELAKIPVQRISTLKEVLEFAKRNNFPANVELKDMKDTPFDKMAVKEVLRIIKETKVENLVLLSSFNHNYIREAHRVAPDIAKAILQENKNPENLVKYLQDLKVDGYHCHSDMIDVGIVKELNDNGFFVGVYTVNDINEKKRLFDMGVKVVFSDYV